MRSHMCRIVLRLFVALGLAVGLAATTQGQEATPATTGLLAQGVVEQMPGPEAEVWFLMFTLEPGGSMPEATQIGPVLLYVETGQVTLTSDQPLGSMQAGDTCPMATPMMPGMGQQHGMGSMQGTPGGDCPFGTPMAECPFGTPMADCPLGTPMMDQARAQGALTLGAGDSVLVAEDTVLGMSNQGDEQTRLAALMVFTGQREVEAAESQPAIEPVGVSTSGIAVGIGSFGSGPYTMTIDRAMIEAGDSLDGGVPGGFELGGVESGSAEATFATGTSWLWPGFSGSGEGTTQAPERTPVDPGSTHTLTAGDSYSISDGTMSWTAGEDSPVTILRAVIAPA